MKMRLALAALLLTSTSAFAADLAPQSVEPAAPMPIAPIYNWTGFYAGVDAGAIFGNEKVSAYGLNDKLNKTGFVGGAHAGYNEQFDGGFVVGLEGDIAYAGVSKSQAYPALDLRGKFKSDWQGSVRARAGYAMGNIMPYLTGGVAFGNQKITAHYDGVSGSDSKTQAGWTAGGGVEYMIDPNWIVRGEVRYTDLGTAKLNLAGARVKSQFRDTQATVGVSYKF